MHKKLNISGTALMLVFVFSQLVSYSQKSQENTLKYGRLLRLIESYYVDTTNIDKLTEKAIVSTLQELDPHSVYITKNEVEKMNEPLKGNFEGIGITFNIFKDTLLVSTTVPGGPSEKVGLLAGDRILFIDGKNIAGIGLTNEDVFGKLRGEKGTKVELRVQRRGQMALLDFSIFRDKIPINSLDAAYMIDKETGYIKLSRFAATTTEEFQAAIKKLKDNKIQNLILDLRNNGGGYLKAATDLADEFLSNNKMIVYTQGKNNPRKDYTASSAGLFETGKLVVLVNEGSASASEIVTGAIQDWDRGLIIGRRSFGKGLVQQPFYLTDGSMVRLTTAHYFTPSGRCIQKPYENGAGDYAKDYQNRMEHGEMFSADSIRFTDSLKYKTLTSSRTVFGGGGIMPDIFVPIDTSALYRYYNRLQRNNIINNTAIDFVDNNRSRILKQFPTFQKFKDDYKITDEMMEVAFQAAEKAEIPRDQESIAFTIEMMKKQFKSLIARDIYSRDDFYQILNEDDTTILKAMEVIKNQNKFNNFLTRTEASPKK